MDWHKIILRPAAPTLTPWQADTIFGHLCWAMARTEGEGFLETFLGLYGLGSPPLVLSNGCPGGLLPRPLLGPRQRGPDTRPLKEQIKDARDSKKARKAQWLIPAEFERARRGENVIPTANNPYREVVTMHNTISRLTGTTGDEGSLFPLEGTTLAAEDEADRVITVYARVDPGFVACLRRCLDYLRATGYGKRKSVGYGALEEARLDDDFAGFTAVGGENGFVSLSNFVPAASDPTDGAWNTIVKRGRLGEEYATKAAGDGNPRPFKRPLVMLAAGSCFYDPTPRPFYGRLVEKVHDDADNFGHVVQYGLALAVGMRLPPKEDQA